MVPPVVLGLTVCRDVVREASGNYSLVRAFSGLPIAGFPGAAGEPFAVFAALAGGAGEVPFDLLVTRFGDDIEPVRQLRGAVRFPDRLGVIQFVVRFPQFPFPAPGTYLFSLYLGGEWAADRAIRAYPAGGRP